MARMVVIRFTGVPYRQVLRLLFLVCFRLVCAKSEAATLLTSFLGLCISFAALLASLLDVVMVLPFERVF